MASEFVATFDAERVSHGLRHTLPSLAKQGDIIAIADGFSSFVFMLGDSIILRVAKHRAATVQHVKELKALALLKAELSLQIPQPQWYLEPSAYFPFGAMAYPLIMGRPFELSLSQHIDLEQVAFSLARFLYELHPLDVPVPRRDDEPSMLWNAVKSTLQIHLSTTHYRQAQRWWRSSRQRAQEHTISSLVHGDLWAENIILDDALSQVVGIVDFELLARGDPAQDFAPQAYVSRDFATQVVSQYQLLGGQLGADFVQRVHDWRIVRELRGLRYAICYPESDELADSLQKVAGCLTAGL